MLTIAGGIVLGLVVLVLLPVLLPLLGRLLAWAVLLIIGAALVGGAYALWQAKDGPTILFILVALVMGGVLKVIVTDLGGITNAVRYFRASIRPARTAEEVAAKARRLQKLREHANALLEQEREQAKRDAIAAIQTEATNTLGQFAPGIPVEFEERTYDYIVRIGGHPIARVEISPPTHFRINPGDRDDRKQESIAESAVAAVAQIKKIFKARLTKEPDLIKQFIGRVG